MCSLVMLPGDDDKVMTQFAHEFGHVVEDTWSRVDDAKIFVFTALRQARWVFTVFCTGMSVEGGVDGDGTIFSTHREHNNLIEDGQPILHQVFKVVHMEACAIRLGRLRGDDV